MGFLTRLGSCAARGRVACVMFCLAIVAAFSAVPATVAAGPSEYQLKAVFLFNFAQFVDWPESTFATADAPLVIGVAGTDPFGAYLDEVVRGEQVKGRALVVKRFSNIEDAADCQILFLGDAGRGRAVSLPESLSRRHVLTVADAGPTARQDAIIQFVDAASRIRLRIDVDRAEASGLTISSKLLRAADIVNNREVRR